MPANASAKSAISPPGPPTFPDSPAGSRLSAMSSRMAVAPAASGVVSPTASVPFSPSRDTVMSTASPSCEGTGVGGAGSAR
jgi:hypothetical protein